MTSKSGVIHCYNESYDRLAVLTCCIRTDSEPQILRLMAPTEIECELLIANFENDLEQNSANKFPSVSAREKS